MVVAGPIHSREARVYARIVRCTPGFSNNLVRAFPAVLV